MALPPPPPLQDKAMTARVVREVVTAQKCIALCIRKAEP
jgi:hypothetical protein